MLSLPQNSLTLASLSADGWQDSGLAFDANLYDFMTAINKGSNDIWFSFDKVNQQLLTAAGSVSVPVRVQGGKLWLRNATNGSNGTGLAFCFYR